MRWNSNLKIGHIEIDKQHEELFKRIDSLVLSSSRSAKSVKNFEYNLEMLENYCLLHFSLEENIMLKCDYPKYTKHKKSHDEFMKMLRQHKYFYEVDGISEKLTLQVKNTIIVWMQNHIAKDDQDIEKYIMRNRSAIS